jgi:crossover junction endodeoxyribonuclease RuvC
MQGKAKKGCAFFMKILGIDPGLALMGYGVIDSNNDKVTLLECGVIITEAGVPFPKRLSSIYTNIKQLLLKYEPDCVAFEELFSGKNLKTVIQVAQARGAAMAAAFDSGAGLYEYTPIQIKQAVAGYGRADKKQVQEMVRLLLGLGDVIKPDDAADAVACAICHAHSCRFAENFRIK